MAVACHRLLGRFFLGAPSCLLDKQLREYLLDINFDRVDQLAATTADWCESVYQRVYIVPSTLRCERKQLLEQLHGGLDVLVGPVASPV